MKKNEINDKTNVFLLILNNVKENTQFTKPLNLESQIEKLLDTTHTNEKLILSKENYDLIFEFLAEQIIIFSSPNKEKSFFYIKEIFLKANKLFDQNFTRINNIKNQIILILIINILKLGEMSQINKNFDLIVKIFEKLNLIEDYINVVNLISKQKDKHNDFYLDHEFLYSLALGLHNVKDLKIINKMLDLFGEYIFFINFSNNLSMKLINIFIKNTNDDTKIIENNMSLCLNLIEKMTLNLNNLRIKDIIKLAYFMTKNNFFRYNYFLTISFWEKTRTFISVNYEFFNIFQQKTIIYSIGKSGFNNKTITDKVFKNGINDLKNERIYSEFELIHLEQKLINLIKAGINLKIYNSNEIKEIVEAYINLFPNKIKLFIDVGPLALKYSFFDLIFWTKFFFYLPTYIESHSDKFQLFSIFKIFNLIFEENHVENSQILYPNLYNLYKTASNLPEIKILKNEISLSLYNETFKGKKYLKSYSLLEFALEKLMTAMSLSFKTEISIDFMIVDFILPEEKIIVESNGPLHYIHYENQPKTLNLNSEFKIKCLKKLGYDIIVLDYESPVSEKISYENSFYEKYMEIKKRKKLI